MTEKKTYIPVAIIIIIFILYLFDLGNPEALRQGTEGFYLQVTKEMFEFDSFLTPLYLGQPHWSKPPLQFYLPLPFYYIFKSDFLFWGRLSVLLLSLGSINLFLNWFKNNLKWEKLHFFIFIISCFGIFKYSRIFMMESALAWLTTIAALYLYSYEINKKKSDLAFAIIFLALSINVKGPVSIIMIGFGWVIYKAILSINLKKIQSINSGLLVFALGTTLGSIWFISSYVEHGQPFIDYFFLRENLGKFNAKSYPMRSVFQGLIFYSFPAILWFPGKKIIKEIKTGNREVIFLFSNFIAFFSLWLIPNQRSHHYAIPCLPFFLSLIFYFIRDTDFVSSFRKYIILFFNFLILLLISSAFIFKEFSNSSLLISVFGILFSTFILFYNNFKYKVVSVLISTFTIYSLLVPNFYLPIVPTRIIAEVKQEKVLVIHRKPFYISQTLGRKIDITAFHKIEADWKKGAYLIIPESYYFQLPQRNRTKVLTSWPVWKRGNKFKEILNAFKAQNTNDLRENMLLILLED